MNQSHTEPGYDPLKDSPTLEPNHSTEQSKLNRTPALWDTITSLGLKDSVLRIATALASLFLVILVIWVMRTFFLTGVDQPASESDLVNQAVLTQVPPVALPNVAAGTVDLVSFNSGIPRLAQLHTTIPERPRGEVTKYTVEAGDTVFGIAEKFGLKPETILWGNYYTLLDNPAFLQVGQILNILPVDGIYHKWSAGEGLNGVSQFYKVTPEEIINYPLNQLTVEAVGDLANPNIEPGTWLIIPNGKRTYISWSAPRITRDNPGIAKQLGAGYCGAITDGPVGIGAFIWPTNAHYLSGYDYSLETNHLGIDLAGETGDPIYATDSGVVVYSGWNDYGYGLMIVVDHGNGWQSLYAHLDATNAGCGAWVNQGQVIGLMGSSGRSSGSHLHFELESDSHGKVNPYSFLPPA